MLKSLALSTLLVLVLAVSGFAGPMRFIATDVEGVSLVSVTIDIEDVKNLADEVIGVSIHATVNPAPDNTIADLIGLFFNVAGNPPATVNIFDVSANDETPTVPPITYSTVSPDEMKNGPWGNNGFEMNFFPIGDGGLGSWDIRWVIFSVGSTPPLDKMAFQQAGARLRSVGIAPDREDSLKLYAPSGSLVVEPEVPEPSTWLMLSAGLGLLALARRRRTA